MARLGGAGARAFLMRLFQAAVAAADPQVVVPPQLPAGPVGRTIVVGAGKAAAAMAQAVERHWSGPIEGLVVTRYGQSLPCRHIEILEAAHPLPDEAAEIAARRMLAAVTGLQAEDLVLCLLSGGGSSLLACPAPGLILDDLRVTTRALLRSGATIYEMNTVRKHLSGIAGGRLALAAWPARVETLAISDVPGDDRSVIASGPTVADPSTFADARAVVRHYGLDVPAAVASHLATSLDETPKPGDRRFDRTEFRLIATPAAALAAAAAAALPGSRDIVNLGDAIQGEARGVGAQQAAMALTIAGTEGHRPTVILSGGETSVTVTGAGRGGRNTEFLLGLALGLDGALGITALACDTDGVDGSEDNAGAFVDDGTLLRARARGLDVARLLADNDAYGCFAALGDLIVTGPTQTNVNDFRAILID